MKVERRLQRLLRWYPPDWRTRYGEEFLALLEDLLNGSPPGVLFRVRVAASGVRERVFSAGLFANRSSAHVQRKTGSLLVLAAWSATCVGGVSFVKVTEHYSSSLPASSRGAAEFAYNLTAGAGIMGSLLVFVAALVAMPSFTRWLRGAGWSQFLERLAMPAIVTIAAIGATIALSTWAHHLDYAQRNGGDVAYSAAFLVLATLVVSAVGLWTSAVVRLALSVPFPASILLWEARLAGGVAISSFVVVGGASLWWFEVARHAPWFISGAHYGVGSSTWSIPLGMTMGLLGVATIVAAWGLSRIGTSNSVARQ